MSTNKCKQAQMKAKQAQLVVGTTTTEWEPAQLSRHKWVGTNGDQQTNGDKHKQAVMSTRASQYDQAGTNRDQQKHGDKHKQAEASTNGGQHNTTECG